MRLLHVVGARPNYMTMAPVILASERWNSDGARGDRTPAARSDSNPSVCFSQALVHTGQHYDAELSDVFFAELGLRSPDHHLGVGSGSHAVQTARVLERIEPLLEFQPNIVLVPGDVNSSMAVALACVKLHIPVAHLEASLRSHDRLIPEEHNRVVIDHAADLLFTTCRDAGGNLRDEGIATDRASFVGNTMIDTLARLFPTAPARPAGPVLALGRHDHGRLLRPRLGRVHGAPRRPRAAALHAPGAGRDDRQMPPQHPRLAVLRRAAHEGGARLSPQAEPAHRQPVL